MQLPEKAEVVIIGGGVNGAGLAYSLANRGLSDVVILEKNYLTCGATGRCGAGIRQQWSTEANTRMAIESVKMFEGLSEELGHDIGLRQGGYLIIGHSDADAAQFKKNVAMQKSLGLGVSYLDPSEINGIVPILDAEGMGATCATWCPTDGHADPFHTTFAYAKAAERLGARIYRRTTVTGIDAPDGAVSKVRTDRGDIKARWVVNAAGCNSAEIAAMAGIDIPIKPYPKEIFATERLKPLFKPMVISFHDGIYFSQQEHGQVVGGISDPEAKPQWRAMPSLRFLKRMASTLTRYVPDFRHLKVLRQWTGFYDVTPDAQPILGEDEDVSGFMQCNGFSGHGFMISPSVTKALSEYILDGRASTLDMKALSKKRFVGELDREASVVG
ncbi:MAG: FAD-binding oxidoreductase [Thermoplasmata archaeon HGW-Thermoplasmata-1]|nr:MAG: FAD-binding oxidoreductase [Thermoplasmata archaeon HGW-Thermoplasmata-1]